MCLSGLTPKHTAWSSGANRISTNAVTDWRIMALRAGPFPRENAWRRCVLVIALLACGISSCAFASESGEIARTMELLGTLIPGGVECQLFQAESGEKYTLVGDLKSFKNGDRVKLTGEIVQMSHCMQETTLLLETVSALNAQGPSP